MHSSELKSVTAFANRSTVLYKETLHHNVSNVRNQKNSTTDLQYWVMSQNKCTLPDHNWPPSTASKSCRKSLCRPRPQECTSMHCSNAKYTGTILLSFLRPGRQDEPNKCSVRWKVNINNYDTPTRGKVKASKGNGTYIRVGAPASFRETHNSTSMDHWENQVDHAYFRSFVWLLCVHARDLPDSPSGPCLSCCVFHGRRQGPPTLIYVPLPLLAPYSYILVFANHSSS